MMQSLRELRDLWEEIDDAIALMPESLLHEAAENPHLSKLDRARVKARISGGNGHKAEEAA